MRGAGGDHAHAGHVAALAAAVPLAQREVGDLVPVGGEPLREVAVPALGAADGVREQAVVDEADPHARSATLVRALRAQPSLAPPRCKPPAPRAAAFAVSTLQPTSAPPAPTPPSRRRARRLGRDPVPQRGGEHRGVRRARRSTCCDDARHRRRGRRRRQRLRGRLAPSWPRAAGARVVHEPRRGYGSAYLAGFAAARGRYIVMARRRPHVRLRRDPALRRAARRRAPSSSWATGWTTSTRARCRGCTATSATRS